MKLTFDTVEIVPEGKVYHGNKAINWVKYNGIIVWKKDFSTNTPLNLIATEGRVREIFIDWSPPESATPDYYNLYRDGKLYKTRLTHSYFKDTGLSYGESHEYYVTALYGVGSSFDESKPSNTDRGMTKDISGSKTFTRNGTFTVPNGVTKLRICMIAGGNGGYARADYYGGSNSRYNSAGGKAGKLVEKLINVYPGQRFSVRIGAGGRRSGCYTQAPGQGSSTYFGNYRAQPGSFTYHYGDSKVTGQSGCNSQSYPDGISQQCTYYSGTFGAETLAAVLDRWTFNWKVPRSVYNVEVCLIGAGGGGGGAQESSLTQDRYITGGRAGTTINRTISVNPGSTIRCGIGRGGKGASSRGAGTTEGQAGQRSYFGSLIAQGGKGGSIGYFTSGNYYNPGYRGDGAIHRSCWNITRDGFKRIAYGGQASDGDGGDAGYISGSTYITAKDGGNGAGGGGITSNGSYTAGDGGPGHIKWLWTGRELGQSRKSYGGQGTIFGLGGRAGYSPMYTCQRYGPPPFDGQGYGAGGGGVYWDKRYAYGKEPYRSGAGAPGICIVGWGTALTSDWNDVIQSNISENNTESTESTEGTEGTSLSLYKKRLGYDILDENFLNQTRYTLLDIEEKNEYISPEIIDKLDQGFEEGYDITNISEVEK